MEEEEEEDIIMAVSTTITTITMVIMVAWDTTTGDMDMDTMDKVHTGEFEVWILQLL